MQAVKTWLNIKQYISVPTTEDYGLNPIRLNMSTTHVSVVQGAIKPLWWKAGQTTWQHQSCAAGREHCKLKSSKPTDCQGYNLFRQGRKVFLGGGDRTDDDSRQWQTSPSPAEPSTAVWLPQDQAVAAWLLLHSWAVGQFRIRLLLTGTSHCVQKSLFPGKNCLGCSTDTITYCMVSL